MITSSPGPASPPAADFHCRRHDIGAGVVRISVSGRLDSAAVDTLDQALRSVSDDGAVTVIDLDELTFVDSTGARTLSAAAARARTFGRRLVAVNGRPDVEQLLTEMGVDRALKLVSAQPSPERSPTTARPPGTRFS
jgi:anti-anti-sigma factor